MPLSSLNNKKKSVIKKSAWDVDLNEDLVHNYFSVKEKLKYLTKIGMVYTIITCFCAPFYN